VSVTKKLYRGFTRKPLSLKGEGTTPALDWKELGKAQKTSVRIASTQLGFEPSTFNQNVRCIITVLTH
jgi:hypothetical protein